MKITASDLQDLKVIDKIIAEVKGGAHKNVQLQAEYIDNCLHESLKELIIKSPEELIKDRFNKYQEMGQFAL